MTKLVIQIPAYNESQNLSNVLKEIPRTIDGVDQVSILVIDDGSTDNTTDVALQNGADYVVRHRNNRGLSNTFMTGIRTSLSLGADIIVNTDADNQYPGEYIRVLVNPIIEGSADMVIANRMPMNNKNFSPIKQQLEALGSWFIRLISGTDAPDAPSGFRAYSRYAALRIQVYNPYSYTLETLIQAGKEQLKITHIPIETNPAVRPSRLHKGVLNFIWHQSGAIVRSYFLYQPLRTFGMMGIPFLLIGFGLVLRFIILYLMGDSGIGRYIQSVSIGGTSLIFGFTLLSLGILGDGLRANRQILQEILVQIRDKKNLISENDVEEILGSPIIRSDTNRENNRK
jgi:glycosyltransferase involved in cell wall biosynthesis